MESGTALDQLLQLYRQAGSHFIGEGVALALAESAPLLAPEDAMRALGFLLSTGYLDPNDAVRGLMLEAGGLCMLGKHLCTCSPLLLLSAGQLSPKNAVFVLLKGGRHDML